jgi:ketosteroid isomerase-like protein
MNGRDHPNRLREALQLLRDALADEGDVPEAQSHWEIPVLPPPDPEGRLSSTDLLAWWFRAPHARTDGTPDWDAYFGDAPRDEARDTRASRPTARATPPKLDEQDTPAVDGWRPLWSIFPELEERLAEEHAQAAVDTLYDFLHAFGCGDVEAAMALIDEDYHVVDGDTEIDRLRMRQYLEALVDELRGWELDVSLAEAPEPCNHPRGILIPARIQVEARHADGGHRSWVDNRMALLRQSGQGDWKIVGLSSLDAW